MQDFDSSTDSTIEWDRVCPVLDEAMADLDDEDRDALLLRYFKNHDFRTIGVEIGVSDDAAQKRVSRALERLRAEFNRRGLKTTAVALSTALSVNAAPAAPIGLATALSTAALAGSTLVTVTKAIAMTTLQKAIIGATIAIAVGTGIYKTRQAADLRSQLQSLQHQEAPVAGSFDQMIRERDAAMGKLAALRGENEKLNRDNAELLKLRGQIGLLRRELADAKDLAESQNNTNALAKIWSVGEIKPIANLKDAGLGSPLAAAETFWWAGANNDAERMKQCLVFDRKTNAEPVSELYSKREARSNAEEWEHFEGIRLLSQTHDMLDSNRASIGIVRINLRSQPDGKVVSSIATGGGVEVLKVGGEWKVVRDPDVLKLSVFDEDSEGVAKMMLRMNPKTLQQLMANPRLPPRTLRAYEALKAITYE